MKNFYESDLLEVNVSMVVKEEFTSKVGMQGDEVFFFSCWVIKLEDKLN